MTLKNAGACVLCVLLCSALFGVGLEEKKEIGELLSGNQVDQTYDEVDEDSAQSLWEKCRLELFRLQQVYEELGLSTFEISSATGENAPKDQALAEENVLEALSLLRSVIGDDAFDCLREEHVILPVSGEDASSRRWHSKHLKYIFSKLDRPADLRRHLIHELLHSTIKAKTPSSAPSQRTPLAPPPKISAAPSQRTPLAPPPKISAGRQIQSTPPHPANQGSEDGSDDGSSSHVTIIVAVVVTALVTFIVSSVIFLCSRRTLQGGSDDYRDENPLLRLSNSVGSGNSYVIDNSFKKLGSKSFDTELSIKIGAASMHSKSSVDSFHTSSVGSVDAVVALEPVNLPDNTNTNVPPIPLKPPPGRNTPPPPPMPPLKPPLGRAVPLPPEPPASLRPPPIRAGPPPPPPPAAPTASKPPAGPPPPGPPPPPFGKKPAPRASPPLHGGIIPPRAPPFGKGYDESSKAKLKPFFWDKVLASPDHSMVWHQLKAGSFQFNEEMIETLFGYNPPEKNKTDKKKESSSGVEQPQFLQIIDSKKAQNLSILLKALNLTSDEIRDALEEGNELPAELLDALLKMAPTAEEELKLRLYNGDLSRIGPAERFLKVLVEIPFAFKRLEALLFMGTMEEDFKNAKESYATLEVACKELRSSRLFLKLLEAVLKTGNRMNVGTFRGDAQAFKLDTLLKLSDVKGTDGKTTLLHFVVNEIIRTEGIRAARAPRDSQSLSSIKSEDLLEDITDDREEYYRNLGLQVVSGLGSQLENVKKAAGFDSDALTRTIARLGQSLVDSRNFLNTDMQSVDPANGFLKALTGFVPQAEGDIAWLLQEEQRVMSLVKSTGDYFHGNSGKEEGLRLFVIVRDFLIMLEKACKVISDKPKKPATHPKKDLPLRQTSTETPRQPPSGQTSTEPPRQPPSGQASTETMPKPPSRQTSTETPRQPPSPDIRQLFPAIIERRRGNSSSSSSSDED